MNEKQDRLTVKGVFDHMIDFSGVESAPRRAGLHGHSTDGRMSIVRIVATVSVFVTTGLLALTRAEPTQAGP